MIDRQQEIDRRLDQYTHALQEMQQQVTNLENQLLQMLQVQFSRLATDIATTLQLPQHQNAILQDLVADHLQQLSVTAQLRPPREQHPASLYHHSTTHTPAPCTEITLTTNRDPRLTQTRP